jgi:hypothetical protein
MKNQTKLSSLATIILLLFLVSCTKNEVTNVKLNISKSKLVLGQTDSLIATITATGDITKHAQNWTSSNPAVGTVEKGLISAISAGTTTITVQAGEKQATCELTVTDHISPEFTNAALLYYGDYYDTKLSNNFVLYLYSSTDTLIAELNTALTVTDSIPTGTYEALSNFSGFDQFVPTTLVPAFQYAGGSYGSWFVNSKIVCPIELGYLNNVLNIGSYSIQYNLIDYFGNTISGSFYGLIPYFDRSSANIAPGMIRQKINSAKIKSGRYRKEITRL